MSSEVQGVTWMTNGQSVISGSALHFMERLDQLIVSFAHDLGAEEVRYPPFIRAADLDKVDYFRSFPHLVTFPVVLDDADENLAEFTDSPLDGEGTVRMTRTTRVTDVLTPAACYHLYIDHSGSSLDRSRVFTTRNTCFRREDHYVPLERQWSFSMREVVIMGTPEEATAFVEAARSFASSLSERFGLGCAWEHASDPFFRPSQNPQYMMQQIDPTKHELTFGGRLAIGSVNYHHDHFGRAYGIERSESESPVTTACLAFGLERWLAALGAIHGPHPAEWPR